MALTDFEKDCIDDIFSSLNPKEASSLPEGSVAGTAIIKHGTEEERQALITEYINESGLAKAAAIIVMCDEQIAYLQSVKTDTQAKLAAMQAYVA